MAGRLLKFCQYSSIVFGMESMLCPYGACNTHHNTLRELFRHCYLTHWQWQIRPFLCDFCFKGFYQKQKFVKHLQSSTHQQRVLLVRGGHSLKATSLRDRNQLLCHMLASQQVTPHHFTYLINLHPYTAEMFNPSPGQFSYKSHSDVEEERRQRLSPLVTPPLPALNPVSPVSSLESSVPTVHTVHHQPQQAQQLGPIPQPLMATATPAPVNTVATPISSSMAMPIRLPTTPSKAQAIAMTFRQQAHQSSLSGRQPPPQPWSRGRGQFKRTADQAELNQHNMQRHRYPPTTPATISSPAAATSQRLIMDRLGDLTNAFNVLSSRLDRDISSTPSNQRQAIAAHLMAGRITERVLSMDRTISRILDNARDEVHQCVQQTVAGIHEELSKQE